LRALLEEGTAMQAWKIAKTRTVFSSANETLYRATRLLERGLVRHLEGGFVLSVKGKTLAERIADLNPHVVDE